MTYFGFLLAFLIPPILILHLIAYFDQRGGKTLPDELSSASPLAALLILIGIALLYTTPWDNYLVATRVWWYDPQLVAGITIGWVPLEEYVFFILQTVFTGLLVLALARHIQVPTSTFTPSYRVRAWASGTMMILWLCACAAFVINYPQTGYISLLLLWALHPIALQLAFGADILWHYRKLAGLAILLPTVYLSLADSLAIGSGTWTINPSQSFNIFIAGLPFEELIFFFCTNTLVVFGMALAISVYGNTRWRSAKSHLQELINQTNSTDQDYSSR